MNDRRTTGGDAGRRAVGGFGSLSFDAPDLTHTWTGAPVDAQLGSKTWIDGSGGVDRGSGTGS